MPCPVPARPAPASRRPPGRCQPASTRRRAGDGAAPGFPRGAVMVATQKIQVGLIHAGKVVTVTAERRSFRLVIDGQAIGMVPRTTTSEIHRYKAYAAHPRPDTGS